VHVSGLNPAFGRTPPAFGGRGNTVAGSDGFTLLEMIVVLAILGLATALVAPSAIRGIDSWRRQSELDALLDQIRALPGEARARGRAIDITDESVKAPTSPLRVASDWKVGVPKAWSVSANGVCAGGEVTIGNEIGQRTIVVAAPFCDPAVRP